MSIGLGSVTPLVLRGSALSGDSLWAWSASCFTILGDSGNVTQSLYSYLFIQIN